MPLTGQYTDTRIPETPAPRQVWLFRHFRRITSSESFLPEVDGLRFIAIGGVVLCHLSVFLSIYLDELAGKSGTGWSAATANVARRILFDLFYNGQQGVELFFVISGFVIARPLLWPSGICRRFSYGRFVKRRILRIEPPYVVAVLGLYAIDRFARHLPSSGNSAAALFSHLTYTYNLAFPGERPLLTTVFWSLEVEVQFYLLAPFLCWAYRRSGDNRVRRISALVLVAAWGALARNIPGLSLLNNGYFFLVGIVLADVVGSRRCTPASVPKVRGMLLGWAAIAALMFVPLRETPYRAAAAIFPLIAGLVLWLAIENAWLKSILSRPLVSVVGGMCYSIYLLHFAVLFFVGRLARHLGATWNPFAYVVFQTVLALTAVILISGIFFKLVERPCMRRDWPQRLWGKTRFAASNSARRGKG